MMISGGWIWLTMMLASAGFTALTAVFIEGWSKGRVKFDGHQFPSLGGVAMSAGVMGLLGFMLYSAITSYPANVPVRDLYAVGLFYPAVGLVAIPAAVAAIFGMCKCLGGFGRGVRALAGGLRNLFDGMRGLAGGSKEQSVTHQAVAAQPQPKTVVDLDQARRKFADVDSLCSSLRQLLKEGSAFDQLGEISTELAKVRSAIEEDSNKQSALGTLLSDYLVPAEQALRLYERLLKRNVSSAQESIKEMQDKILPLMHSRIEALYDQIHVADIAQLATVASTFEVARNLEVKLEAEAKL